MAQTLVDFAHLNQITQIFLARSRERSRVPLWQDGLMVNGESATLLAYPNSPALAEEIKGMLHR